MVDDEDEYFQEYHIVDDVEEDLSNPKTLPPEYYVMAVDNDIYKRMLDEVIESKSMVRAFVSQCLVRRLRLGSFICLLHSLATSSSVVTMQTFDIRP